MSRVSFQFSFFNRGWVQYHLVDKETTRVTASCFSNFRRNIFELQKQRLKEVLLCKLHFYGKAKAAKTAGKYHLSATALMRVKKARTLILLTLKCCSYRSLSPISTNSSLFLNQKLKLNGRNKAGKKFTICWFQSRWLGWTNVEKRDSSKRVIIRHFPYSKCVTIDYGPHQCAVYKNINELTFDYVHQKPLILL